MEDEDENWFYFMLTLKSIDIFTIYIIPAM
jgi:hypothetical protein